MAEVDPTSEATVVPSASGTAADKLTESWLPAVDGSAESRSMQAAARRLIRAIVSASWDRTGMKPEPIEVCRLLQNCLRGGDPLEMLLSELPEPSVVAEIEKLRHSTYCWVASEADGELVAMQALMLLDRQCTSR